MDRVGATGSVDNLRPDVATLITGEDLTARFPSSDDLATMLNIAPARARRIRESPRRVRGRRAPGAPGTSVATDATITPAAARSSRPRERSIPRAVRIDLPWPARMAREIIILPDMRLPRSLRPPDRLPSCVHRAGSSTSRREVGGTIVIE